MLILSLISDGKNFAIGTIRLPKTKNGTISVPELLN
jgi:hypothetical protein